MLVCISDICFTHTRHVQAIEENKRLLTDGSCLGGEAFDIIVCGQVNRLVFVPVTQGELY